jgi:hypothetical protein
MLRMQQLGDEDECVMMQMHQLRDKCKRGQQMQQLRMSATNDYT